MIRQRGEVEIRGFYQAGPRRQFVDGVAALVVHLVGGAAAGIEQHIPRPQRPQVSPGDIDIVLVNGHRLIAIIARITHWHLDDVRLITHEAAEIQAL